MYAVKHFFESHELKLYLFWKIVQENWDKLVGLDLQILQGVNSAISCVKITLIKKSEKNDYETCLYNIHTSFYYLPNSLVKTLINLHATEINDQDQIKSFIILAVLRPSA